MSNILQKRYLNVFSWMKTIAFESNLAEVGSVLGRSIASTISINIGTGSAFLSDSIKPLPEWMLTHHQYNPEQHLSVHFPSELFILTRWGWNKMDFTDIIFKFIFSWIEMLELKSMFQKIQLTINQHLSQIMTRLWTGNKAFSEPTMA